MPIKFMCKHCEFEDTFELKQGSGVNYARLLFEHFEKEHPDKFPEFRDKIYGNGNMMAIFKEYFIIEGLEGIK